VKIQSSKGRVHKQGSAANSSVKEDLADAKPPPVDSAAVSVSAVPDPVQVAPPEVLQKSKAKSERDLPRAVGTLGTPEEASTPHISVKEDLEDVNSSALTRSADQVNSAFGAAQAKALEVAGKFRMSGKFVTSIHWNPSSSAEAVNALFDEAKKKALEQHTKLKTRDGAQAVDRRAMLAASLRKLEEAERRSGARAAIRRGEIDPEEEWKSRACR